MKYRWILLLVLFLSACGPKVLETNTPAPIMTFTPELASMVNNFPSNTPTPDTLLSMPSPFPTKFYLNERAIYVANISGENIQKILVGNYFLPKFTLDAKQIIFAETSIEPSHSKLLIYDREAQQTLELEQFDGEIIDITLSPPGNSFSVLVQHENNTEIYEYQFLSKEVIKLYETEPGNVIYEPLSWSFDQKWIAFGSCVKFTEMNLFPPCEVLILDVETKEVQQVTTISNRHENERNSKPAWSPIDYRLAYIHSEGITHFVKILEFGQTPPTTSEIAISTNTGIQPIWSPDAKSVLVDGAMILNIATVRDGGKTELLDLGLGLYSPVSWPAYERILLVGGSCCSSNIIIMKGQPLDIKKQEFKPWLNGTRFYQYEPNLSVSTDEIVFIGVHDPGY